MYFYYLATISSWKRVWPFIWIKLNPLHPRMLCAKFGWNWHSGSGEKEGKCKRFTDSWMMDNRQSKLDNLICQHRWAKMEINKEIKCWKHLFGWILPSHSLYCKTMTNKRTGSWFLGMDLMMGYHGPIKATGFCSNL